MSANLLGVLTPRLHLITEQYNTVAAFVTMLNGWAEYRSERNFVCMCERESVCVCLLHIVKPNYRSSFQPSLRCQYHHWWPLLIKQTFWINLWAIC